MLCCPLQGVLLVALLLSLSQADLKECFFIACFFLFWNICEKGNLSLPWGRERGKRASCTEFLVAFVQFNIIRVRRFSASPLKQVFLVVSMGT